MSVKRNFNFAISTLLYEGNLVLTAAETDKTFATKRLKDGLLTDARGLWSGLGGGGGSAAQNIATTAALTQQEKQAYQDMLDLFGKLKDAAKKAFAGDQVKLREQFQVGINAPKDLGSILKRAKIARDSAQKPENVDPLRDKGGWIVDDATALNNAIKSVEQFDMQQHNSITIEIADTDSRNASANSFYDKLRTIQGAADIEWPERVTENRSKREGFRLATFPPARSKPEKPSPAPAPPA
jgi:hypothetical protein